MEAAPGRKIAVVEDDEQIRVLVEKVLKSGGYGVVSTGDPTAAVDLVRRETPDLILCDIAMPGMDGYAVLKALQADPETAQYPVVFLTAHREFTERVQAFRFGVVDYMTKPFTREVLLRRVERVLQSLQKRPGHVAASGREGAVDSLLGEVRKEARTGIIRVEGEAGETRVVVKAGEIVEKSGPLAPGTAAKAEFQELDPTREQIVAGGEATKLPGDAAALPSFDTVPEVLRTVLVVDDNRVFRTFLRQLLSGQGFTVHEAADGEEGLKLALERRPWLILTDVSMPRMDGFELCRRVRSHTLVRHTPLIFLSGWDDYKERYRGMEAGADEYLSKETPVRELLIRIHLILKRFSDAGGRGRTGAGMEGRLDLVGPTGALQMCHLGRFTGVLTVRSGNRTLHARFREGDLVGADAEGAAGADAVFELLSWTRGYFEFVPGDPGEGSPLGQSFEEVLLEGCRRLDEGRRSSQ